MSQTLSDYFSTESISNSRQRLYEQRQAQRQQERKGLAIGFDDISINGLWDAAPRDQIAVDLELAHIRNRMLPPHSFTDKLLRCFNDHKHVRFDSNSSELFEPLYVPTPKRDMVTLLGMQVLSMYGVGKQPGSFTHYTAGTGNTPESLTDTRLADERTKRVSMITNGYRFDSGANMSFLGRFPTTEPTMSVSEAGVFNAEGGGVPLFRTVYTDDEVINHKQLKTFFSLSQNVNMISLT